MTNDDHEYTVGDPQSILLGPVDDPESDDWRLSFQTVTGERVGVRLHRRALDELYVEAKDLPADALDADRLPLSERVDVYHDQEDDVDRD